MSAMNSNMSRVRSLVHQRLNAAAEDIQAEMERCLASVRTDPEVRLHDRGEAVGVRLEPSQPKTEKPGGQRDPAHKLGNSEPSMSAEPNISLTHPSQCGPSL